MAKKSQNKPAKKVLKKYNLAGYNMSSLSQAPQASYYLGKSAAQSSGESLDPTMAAITQQNAEMQKQSQQQSEEDRKNLLNQTQGFVGDLAGISKELIKYRAALKAAEEASKAAAGANFGGTTAAMADEAGIIASGAGAGQSAGAAAGMSPGLVQGITSGIGAGLSLAGTGLKMSGDDKNAATYGDKERKRDYWGTIMQSAGTGVGMGSVFGPVGSVVGGLAGIGYGVHQANKATDREGELAQSLTRSNRLSEEAYRDAFVNSRLMDVNRGGQQFARYGGMKYAMGGPGDPENPYTVTGIDPKADYERAMNQYKIDYMKARYTDIETANPRTLQDRIPYPTMPMTERQQRRVEAGKNPSTLFKYYPADPSFAGTRELNRWNNQTLDNAGLEGFDRSFRKELPSPEEMKEDNSGGGGININFPSRGGSKGWEPRKSDQKKLGLFRKLFMSGQERHCRNMHSSGVCLDETYRTGGMADYYAVGGVRQVEGGVIKPIPNSNDVEFIGRSHEEGGIKLDKYTEVEGKETATKINNKEYYFSDFLKENGKSYAQMHKEIASSNLPETKKKNLIKELAKKQEARAGRNPKSIKASGGFKYAAGGLGCPDGYINDPVYGCIPEYLDQNKTNFIESGMYMGDVNNPYRYSTMISPELTAEDVRFNVKEGKSSFYPGPGRTYTIPAQFEESFGAGVINPYLTVNDPINYSFSPSQLRGINSVTDDEVKDLLSTQGITYNTTTKKYEKNVDGKKKSLTKEETKKAVEEAKREVVVKDASNQLLANTDVNLYRTNKMEGPVATGDETDAFGYYAENPNIIKSENGKDCPPGYYPDLKGNCIKAPEGLEFKTNDRPGLAAGLAQLIPVAYAAANPYQRVNTAIAPGSVGKVSLGRVSSDREIEEARRQQNTINRAIQNSNLGPGKFSVMTNLAAKTNEQIGKIADTTNKANIERKGRESQINAEISRGNQQAALEAAKASKMMQLDQNKYVDERNLAVIDTLASRIANIDKDTRNYKLQKDIARALDETGAFGRYEILDQLRKMAKDKNSPVYGMSEGELRGIASVYGEDYGLSGIVVKDKENKNKEDNKKLGGIGRKYTSRLGELTSSRKTLAKK